MKMMVLECTVMNMESSIKGLLEKWSQLEPHLCKRETRPNKDWHEEFEDYKLTLPHGEYLVYSDHQVYTEGHFDCWTPNKEVAMAMVQWAVQQAIIEKGWFLRIQNWQNADGYYVRVDIKGQNRFDGKTYNNITEGLLAAYLKVLEARKVAD